MDERKYWAFRVRSSPDAIKQRIAYLVENNNLREQIPRMYCEKTTARRGVREFYFFLNIIDEEGGIPYGVLHRSDLQAIGKLLAEESLTFEEIKTMAGPEIDLESIKYARQIIYQPPEAVRLENPFDLAIVSEPNNTSRESYNDLLYWMSAVGKGTWQAFREACKTLGLSNFAEARHIFRRLRLLGHIEYLNNGSHWTICTPCLVKVLDHEPRYFLSGARVPALTRAIQGCANVEVHTEGNDGGPDSIFVTVSSDVYTQSVITTLRETYPQFQDAGMAGTKLANILPDLNGWYRDIISPIGVASERYRLDKWDGEDFGVAVAQPGEAGMYRLKKFEDQEQELSYYYYFDPERNCWLQGDWYGLRFLANHHIGIQAKFTYEADQYQLFIPSIRHLPDIYERALVLASGKLPSSVQGGLVYENVNRMLAQTVTSKLYAEFITGI